MPANAGISLNSNEIPDQVRDEGKVFAILITACFRLLTSGVK